MDIKNQNNSADNELLQLVSFKLGNEEFGIEIAKVQEINRITSLTQLPNSPSYIEGIVNLRGKLVPIVNLRKKFGMTQKDASDKSRIIVVNVADKTLGFIVDEVTEVLRIPIKITEAPPEVLNGSKTDFITAVGKLNNKLIILLDVEKITSTNEVNNYSSAA